MEEFNPLSESHIIESLVDSWRNEICQMVNGTGVMNALVPHILSHDNQSVLSGLYMQNYYRGNALLLYYLRQTKARGKWTAFIDALRQNSYWYLASLLTGEYKSPKNNCNYERSIITIFNDYLAHKIDISIISKLRTRGVLTRLDEEKIEREKDRSGSIGAAVLMLKSIQQRLGPHEWYYHFLTVLRDKGFTDIVRGIEPDFIPKGNDFDSRKLAAAQFYGKLPLRVAALRKQLMAKQEKQRIVFLQVKKSVKLFKTVKQDLQSKYKRSRDSYDEASKLLDELETDDLDETEKEEKFRRIASMSHPGRLEFQYSNVYELLGQVKCLGNIIFCEPDSLSGIPDSMTGSFTSDQSGHTNFSLDSESSESYSETGSVRSFENPSKEYSRNSFRSTGSDPDRSDFSSRCLFASSNESQLVGPNPSQEYSQNSFRSIGSNPDRSDFSSSLLFASSSDSQLVGPNSALIGNSSGLVRSFENPSQEYSHDSLRSTGSDPGRSDVSLKRLFPSSKESQLVGPNSASIGNLSQARQRQNQQPSRAEPVAPPGKYTDLTTAPSNGASSSASELPMETLRIHSPPINTDPSGVERHTLNTMGRNPPRTTPSERTLRGRDTLSRPGNSMEGRAGTSQFQPINNVEETSPAMLQRRSQQQQEFEPPPPYELRLFPSSKESQLVGPNSASIGNLSQARQRQNQQPSRAEPAAPPGKYTDLTTAPSNGASSSASELAMETLMIHSPPTDLEPSRVEWILSGRRHFESSWNQHGRSSSKFSTNKL